MKALERLVGTWDHEQTVKVPKETRLTASLILAVLMNANIRGQESSAPPEMKALEGLLGTWEVLTVNKVAKWTPEETRSTTICKREPILGGRYFRESAFDQQGKLLATGMLTYDTTEKVYRFWYFHPEGVTENAGTWDGSSRRFLSRSCVARALLAC